MRKIIYTFSLLSVFSIAFYSCQKEDDNSFDELGAGNDCTSCVHYAKKVLGITGSTTMHAKDWGKSGYYTIPNYSQTSNPSINDIIVIEPELTEWATSSAFLTSGHVGFVKSIENLSNGSLKLTVKGGNQSGGNECGCLKVSTLPLTIPQSKLHLVRFYTKSNPNFYCDGFQNTQTQNPPTLILPSHNSTNISSPVTFSWQNLGGDAVYRIQVSKSLSDWNEDNGFTTASSLIINQETGSNSYYTSNSLQQNTTYYWSVRTYKNYIQSKYSQPFKFTTSGGSSSTPNPTFSPIKETFTSCSFSDINGTGDCAGWLYKGATIKVKVATYNSSSNTINFRIEKCSGSFSNSGTAYIKQGNYCGNVIATQSYGVGASGINLSITPPSSSGTYTYTAVIVSATTDRFYTLPITVQY